MNKLIKLFDVAPMDFQGALVMLVLFAVLGYLYRTESF